MRSLRRCSWFSTCPHCVLIASSCPTKRLYEHPESPIASSATSTAAPVLRISFIRCSSHTSYHDPPPPPPPLRPPPNPPKPPPKPPNPPPNPPRPNPPPNGPTPLFQPLHGVPPQ